MEDNQTYWLGGIGLSVAASVIGGASKLAIRKAWLLVEEIPDLDCDPSLQLMKVTPTEFQLQSHAGLERKVLGYHDRSCDSPYFVENYLERPMEGEKKKCKAYSSSRFKSKCLLGFGMCGMTFLNPLCCTLAMRYASPSILAPFSGLTLVWIVLFSEFLVGERPQFFQILAAALIIMGEVIIAVYGDHTNDQGMESVESMLRSYLNLDFMFFAIILIVWMVFMLYVAKFGTSRQQRFAWGVLGGSVTGFQNFLKDSLTILGLSDSVYPPPVFFAFILLAMATSLSGLLFLAACMKRYDATYSSSMFVGSFVISASFMSAVHYHTFDNLETIWNVILYILGLFVLLIGVVILALSPEGTTSSRHLSRAGGILG